MAVIRSVSYCQLREVTMASGGIKNEAYPPPHTAVYSSTIKPIHFNIKPQFFGQNDLSKRRLQWAGLPSCRATAGRFQLNTRKISLVITCCGKAPSTGQSEFQEKVLNSDLPVLVDFVADWCGPCKLIAPFIDWASQEYKGKLKVFKIDHDANPQLVEKYKVYGLPTLILFKDGQEVSGSRREGAITREKLKVYLDQLLETVAAR